MSRMRRLMRDLSSILILAGVLLVLDAGVTFIWQEPVTAAIGLVLRGQVNDRFLSYRTAPLTPLDERVLAHLRTHPERVSFLARRLERQLKAGDAVGTIVIPRIGASYTIVQGTDALSLAKGPGHYPGTALPGLGRTVAIAGHRTTYLAPFRHIDGLRPGDRIVLRMPYGRFSYAVSRTRVVLPTALWVTRDLGYDQLVLSACNPLYSAAQRIVVFARFTRREAARVT